MTTSCQSIEVIISNSNSNNRCKRKNRCSKLRKIRACNKAFRKIHSAFKYKKHRLNLVIYHESIRNDHLVTELVFSENSIETCLSSLCDTLTFIKPGNNKMIYLSEIYIEIKTSVIFSNNISYPYINIISRNIETVFELYWIRRTSYFLCSTCEHFRYIKNNLTEIKLNEPRILCLDLNIFDDILNKMKKQRLNLRPCHSQVNLNEKLILPVIDEANILTITNSDVFMLDTKKLTSNNSSNTFLTSKTQKDHSLILQSYKFPKHWKENVIVSMDCELESTVIPNSWLILFQFGDYYLEIVIMSILQTSVFEFYSESEIDVPDLSLKSRKIRPVNFNTLLRHSLRKIIHKFSSDILRDTISRVVYKFPEYRNTNKIVYSPKPGILIKKTDIFRKIRKSLLEIKSNKIFEIGDQLNENSNLKSLSKLCSIPQNGQVCSKQKHWVKKVYLEKSSTIINNSRFHIRKSEMYRNNSHNQLKQRLRNQLMVAIS